MIDVLAGVLRHGLFGDPKRATHTNGGEVTRVDQPIDRHPRHAKPRSGLGNIEKPRFGQKPFPGSYSTP